MEVDSQSNNNNNEYSDNNNTDNNNNNAMQTDNDNNNDASNNDNNDNDNTSNDESNEQNESIPQLTSEEINAQFDSRRPIRSLITNPNHKISIPVRLLNAELTCAVCLGIIRECTAVMQCLHRFCSNCIEKSIRLGKKECPQCRVGCPTRRNLRADQDFDCIIAAIYPDLDKAEQQQDQFTETIIKESNIKQFASSVLKGAQQQNEKARIKALQAQQEKQRQQEENERRRKRNLEHAQSISITLYQHPALLYNSEASPRYAFKKKYLRLMKAFPIHLIKKYLHLKLKLNSNQKIVISFLYSQLSEAAKQIHKQRVEKYKHAQAISIADTLGVAINANAKGMFQTPQTTNNTSNNTNNNNNTNTNATNDSMTDQQSTTTQSKENTQNNTTNNESNTNANPAAMQLTSTNNSATNNNNNNPTANTTNNSNTSSLKPEINPLAPPVPLPVGDDDYVVLTGDTTLEFIHTHMRQRDDPNIYKPRKLRRLWLFYSIAEGAPTPIPIPIPPQFAQNNMHKPQQPQTPIIATPTTNNNLNTNSTMPPSANTNPSVAAVVAQIYQKVGGAAAPNNTTPITPNATNNTNNTANASVANNTNNSSPPATDAFQSAAQITQQAQAFLAQIQQTQQK